MILTPECLRLPPGKRYDLIMAYNLKKDLVGAWPLDEASGTRRDHSGLGNNLTDSNTVTGGAGPSVLIPTASDFESTNLESLTLADNPNIRLGNIDWSMACLGRLESAPVDGWMGLLTKYTDATHRDYQLLYKDRITAPAGKNFLVAVYSAAGVEVGLVDASTFGQASLNTWYRVYAYHNASLTQLGIRVNMGAWDTGSTTAAPGSSTAGLRIGARDDASLFWDGLQAYGFIWKRLLTEQEWTWWDNRGAGRSIRQLMLVA